MIFFILLLGCNLSLAATQAEIDDSRARGLKWLIENQNPDGSWGAGLDEGIITTAYCLQVLIRSGVAGYPYASGLAWLRNTEAHGTTALARQIITLNENGLDTTELTTRLISRRGSRYYSWGAHYQHGVAYPETAYALDALSTMPDLASQNVDLTLWTIALLKDATTNQWRKWPTGWSTQIDGHISTIATASNIIALDMYKSDYPTVPANPGPGVTVYALQTEIDSAINALITAQRADGGFGDDANVLNDDSYATIRDTAFAYQAISAVNGSADLSAIDAQEYLINRQSANGDWIGKPLDTALALQTLPETNLPDDDGDGIPNIVEIHLGTNPALQDGRYLADGAGFSVLGETQPTTEFTADMLQFSSHQLDSGTGHVPFTWSIISGHLPAGLILNENSGMINGIAEESGEYNLRYRATDSFGTSNVFLIRVAVETPPLSIHDGDISGDGIVDHGDVLLAYRALLGLTALTQQQRFHADVAPVVNGTPAPDGLFNLGDVLVISRKALGKADF